MTFYARGRKEKNFEAGVTKALEAILASPQFLFRVEETPAATQPAGSYRLGDYELASRLSFFLLGQRARRGAAEGGGPGPPGAARRAWRSRRSGCWRRRVPTRWPRALPRSGCACRTSSRSCRIRSCIPYSDQTLSLALKKETELFFDSLVREDRSVLDLLTADYTYVNERVARHYGIPNVTGTEFRRVALPDDRRGILGHGSVLTLTSIAERTSPVQRGKWVMEVLLGSPPPPPPPNVPALEETKGTADPAARCRCASGWSSTAATRSARRAIA